MRTAPCLRTAKIPAATLIHADSAHWSVAIQALIRGVAYDGLELYHSAVRQLVGILLPIVDAEMAYNEIFDRAVSIPELNWDEDMPYFPELDGPLFLLGSCVLVDAFGAVVGDDLFDDILGVLLPPLTDAVPGLDGQAAANALIGAYAVHNNCDQPGNAEAMERICAISCGDVLGDLAAAGAVPTELLLPVGLTMLSVLADLCRSESPSLLQRSPPTVATPDPAAALRHNGITARRPSVHKTRGQYFMFYPPS
jgi:hypothetical protein